jgi:hypothetical protein
MKAGDMMRQPLLSRVSLQLIEKKAVQAPLSSQLFECTNVGAVKAFSARSNCNQINVAYLGTYATRSTDDDNSSRKCGHFKSERSVYHDNVKRETIELESRLLQIKERIRFASLLALENGWTFWSFRG